MSLQVHPVTAFIREKFGLTYTQDESYSSARARAEPGVVVYLGLKEGIDRAAMERDLTGGADGRESISGRNICEYLAGRKALACVDPGGND